MVFYQLIMICYSKLIEVGLYSGDRQYKYDFRDESKH